MAGSRRAGSNKSH
jgi:putative transposase